MPKAGVIGLDLGSGHVRAAELRFGRGGPAGEGTPVLARYAEVPLPPGAVRDGEVEEPGTVTQALKRLWEIGRFSSRDVNIGVGNQRVVVRELELPWLPPAQIRASLPYQVEDLIPIPVDEAVLDYFPTGDHEGPGGRVLTGMLVAATRSTVQANLAAVESAGLRPRLVDLNAFALVRALGRGGEHADRTVGLVEIGARITQVVVVARGVPRFVRMLPSGGQNVTDALADALRIGAAEAEDVKRAVGIGDAVGPEVRVAAEAISTVVQPLAEAIRNTFVYYASNNPGAGIELTVLTGGGSQLPGLDRYLAATTRSTVVAGDPLSSVRVADSAQPELVTQRTPVLATPLGLAYGVAA